MFLVRHTHTYKCNVGGDGNFCLSSPFLKQIEACRRSSFFQASHRDKFLSFLSFRLGLPPFKPYFLGHCSCPLEKEKSLPLPLLWDVTCPFQGAEMEPVGTHWSFQVEISPKSNVEKSRVPAGVCKSTSASAWLFAFSLL